MVRICSVACLVAVVAAMPVTSFAQAPVMVDCFRLDFQIAGYGDAVLSNVLARVSSDSASATQILTDANGRPGHGSLDFCQKTPSAPISTIEIFTNSTNGGNAPLVDVIIKQVIDHPMSIAITLKPPA